MYQIDFPNKILENLPADKRSEFNAKLLEWWLSELESKHQQWYAFGVAKMKIAKTTSQIGSLVKFLNSTFNTSLIYITDAEAPESDYIYQDGEPYESLWLFLDGEAVPLGEQVYLDQDGEGSAFDFIVWIPAILDTPENLELINNYLNQLVFAGIVWDIQIIP